MPRIYRDRKYQDRIAYEAFLQCQRRRKAAAALNRELTETIHFIVDDYADYKGGSLGRSLLSMVKNLKGGKDLRLRDVEHLYKEVDKQKTNDDIRTFSYKLDGLSEFFEVLIQTIKERESAKKKKRDADPNVKLIQLLKRGSITDLSDKGEVSYSRRDFYTANDARWNAINAFDDGKLPKLQDLKIWSYFLAERVKKKEIDIRRQVDDAKKYLAYYKKYLVLRRKKKPKGRGRRGRPESLLSQMNKAY